MLFQLFLVASFAATSIAAPFREPYVRHEKRDTLIKTRQTKRVDANALVPVRIGLRQRNLEHTYSYLSEVSHPRSSNYGRHWTAEEVDAKFAPSEETISTVRDWLISLGISNEDVRVTSNKGWVAVDLPAWRAEEMFKTTYYEHESLSDGTVRLGCDEYHLPERITGHVDYIRPGVTLSPPLRKRTVTRTSAKPQKAHKKRSRVMPRFSNNTELQNCGSAITPTCLRALYNIPEASGSDDSNALGVFENQNDVYSQSDLDKFFAKYAPQVPSGTHPTINEIDGAPTPVPSSSSLVTGESNVDFSIAYSLLYPQSIVLYQTEEVAPSGGDEVENEFTYSDNFLDAVDGSFCTDDDKASGFQCGNVGLTPVTSFSYSSPELQWTDSAADRTCNEFAKLSLQGYTFVISSGDFGPATHPDGDSNGCVDRSSVDPAATQGTVFNPQFPNTCPYVLSVGATQLSSNQTIGDPESALLQPDLSSGAATFSSSGGFSNYESTPDYQGDAVSTYLSSYAPDYPTYEYTDSSSIQNSDGLYNRAGRGIPDVSANGANFMTFIVGQELPMFGTSLAAPIWASMLTLINQERTKQGKGSVGFVNSVLYQNTQIFHDITSGNAPGCGTDGFYAVDGWDPVTGLGTPDFPTMLDVFLNLP